MNKVKNIRRRLLIAGYYGFGNAGDELILMAMLQQLRSLNGESIRVLSNDPEKTEDEHHIQAVDRSSLWQICKAIYQSEIFVLGGGGLLQDESGNLSIWYYLRLLWIALFFRKKIFVYAVGVGVVRYFWNRKLVALTLNHVDVLTVRDHESKRDLVNFGVKKEIHVTADPVLSLELSRMRAVSPGVSQSSNGSLLKCAIIPRVWSKWKEIVPEVAEVSDSLIKKFKAKIFIVPFHPEVDLPITIALTEKLKDRIELFHWQTSRELIQFFSETDLIISFRLHGLILGSMLQKTVVGVALDRKIGDFMNYLSPENVVEYDHLDADKLLNSILKCWSRRENFSHILKVKIPELKAQADRTAQLVVKFIQSGTKFEKNY